MTGITRDTPTFGTGWSGRLIAAVLVIGIFCFSRVVVADALCGNGIVEAGEDCDDGGTCIGGSNAGTYCTAEVDCFGNGVCVGGVKDRTACTNDSACPGGLCRHCVPQGGDGCAANCTLEQEVPVNLVPGVIHALSALPIGSCSGTDAAKYGPDQVFCTDDDPQSVRGTATTSLATTGTATASVTNANQTDGDNLGGPFSVSGAPFSCTDLAAGSAAGAGLAYAFTQLNQPTAGDIVVPGAQFVADSILVPTPTPPPLPSECIGDCSRDSTVTIDELITMVNIALGNASVSACPGVDQWCNEGDLGVTIDCIIVAVNSALEGCPGPTPTPTNTPACAPTGTPYCSDFCPPSPTPAPGCPSPGGYCLQNPYCFNGEPCYPRGPYAGCCECAGTPALTPTPTFTPTPTGTFPACDQSTPRPDVPCPDDGLPCEARSHTQCRLFGRDGVCNCIGFGGTCACDTEGSTVTATALCRNAHAFPAPPSGCCASAPAMRRGIRSVSAQERRLPLLAV